MQRHEFSNAHMTIDEKIALAQKLLVSIAEEEIGQECNPGLCQWLHDTADELEERLT
jgi:hypothetical protein